MNFLERSGRFLREVMPSSSKSVILFMAILAFTLSSCVSVSVTYAEDPEVAATAMHYENVAAIQSFATAQEASGYYDWTETGPCAESAVRVETMVPGSGNLINRKLVKKLGSDGQLIDQDVIQVFVSGHQATPDLTQMLGQLITVAPPLGVEGEPGQYMILSASTIVDLTETGDDVVSIIAVGEPGKLSGSIPVGDRIGSGMDLNVGTEIFVASIPSGAGVLGLSPTRATTTTAIYDGMIFAVPQNNSKSVPSMQGGSGAGGCEGGALKVTTTRADMENMGFTPFDRDTAPLALQQFLGTLDVLAGSYGYIIQ